VLRQDGTEVSGSIDVQGYGYNLQARADGDRARGTLSDPQTGGGGYVEIVRAGADLALTVSVGGQQLRMDLEPEGGGAGAAAAAAPRPAAPAQQHDPRLVGNWRRTESMTSGDFTMATDHWLVIRPDGTFTVGTGGSAGGGAAGSFSSGGSEGTSGRWKTQGAVVYVEDGGWQPYARFYREGDSLMFTFGNGKREVWTLR
jgi:hypothetical protein